MNNFKLSTLGLLAAGGLAFSLQASSAALMIDDFLDPGSYVKSFSSTMATTGAINLVNGTDLTGATRELQATSLTGGVSSALGTSIFAGEGFLSISNDTGVTGTASAIYNFSDTDLTGGGILTALLLDVESIDLSTQVKISLGDGTNTSVSDYQSFDGPGTFFNLLSGFGGVDVASANYIRLDFKGATAWDGRFTFLATNEPPTIPEPATLGLFGIGLLGFAASRFRKAA
ncbi:hypothetical protein CKO12_03395 [Chromatium okenii]|uniref:PEP-CTERM sorting domain-containing protein n=1 Tax=Chromatium okenii TaxID=61644 RepID=UPI001902F4F0|nr:PEP-CTERM sorting domain-containing protein [Chromatium okenii]MBK1640936.1 hypothetical protein [Chromatium okenii]